MMQIKTMNKNDDDDDDQAERGIREILSLSLSLLCPVCVLCRVLLLFAHKRGLPVSPLGFGRA